MRVLVSARQTTFGAIAVLAISTAISQAAPGDMRRACGADLKAQCSGVQLGGRAIIDCMADHREQLSQDCKVAFADQMLEQRAP